MKYAENSGSFSAKENAFAIDATALPAINVADAPSVEANGGL